MVKLVCPFSVEVNAMGADKKPLRNRCKHLKRNTGFCGYDGVIEIWHSHILESLHCNEEKTDVGRV